MNTILRLLSSGLAFASGLALADGSGTLYNDGKAIALKHAYAYRMPDETFEPWDKFFVSRKTVVPSELVSLGDLVEQHADGGTELRTADSLYPLWDEVIATTLDFSGIRLRNAVRA